MRNLSKRRRLTFPVHWKLPYYTTLIKNDLMTVTKTKNLKDNLKQFLGF